MSLLDRPAADPFNTLPMFSAGGHPDGWHGVTAPGGYEWWYFDAEDLVNDVQVVAIFLEGFLFHPGYLRQYARFRRRPTKIVPPTAGDFPCAYFVVYRGGKIVRQFMTQFRRDQFAAKPDRPDVVIGPNVMTLDETNVYRLSLVGTPWILTGRGPQLQTDQILTAELSFTPRFGLESSKAEERTFLSREMTGAEHRWVLAAPRCDVRGRIELGEPAPLDFAGRGYHDHNFGTAPIGPGLKRWIWGRVLFEDRVVSFHYARGKNRRLPDEVHLLEADADGFRELSPEKTQVDWSLKTPVQLLYPSALHFGSALELSNPRLVDSSPFYMRLIYDAVSRGERGSAFCEVAYPHRLRWPVLGRMIEMSFDKRELKAER